MCSLFSSPPPLLSTCLRISRHIAHTQTMLLLASPPSRGEKGNGFFDSRSQGSPPVNCLHLALSSCASCDPGRRRSSHPPTALCASFCPFIHHVNNLELVVGSWCGWPVAHAVIHALLLFSVYIHWSSLFVFLQTKCSWHMFPVL